MERAIAHITDYIATCVECRIAKKEGCAFLLYNGEKSSSYNDPYKMEDYIMDLPREKRAFKLLESRGMPCSTQSDFEQYFRKLEERLDDVYFPETSSDLLRLISRLDRIYGVVDRNADIYYYAFNDLVAASVDKCMACIDYYYLELGIDIQKVIKSVSHEYDRDKAMQGMYPYGIVSSYVKNALVLELDDLTSKHDKIVDIANDVYNKRLMSERAETGIHVANDNVLKSPGCRNLTCSAAKELKEILRDNTNRIIVLLLLSAFGYDEVVDSYDTDDDIDRDLDFEIDFMDEHYGIFNRWKKLQDEINESISRNISDSKQIINYCVSLIKSAELLSPIFYPSVDTSALNKEAAVLLKVLADLKSSSYKPIVDIWKESVEEAKERMLEDDLTESEYLDLLYRIAVDKAREEGNVDKMNEFTLVNSLIVNMKNLMICLNGCLLKAGWDIDYIFLQEQAGVALVDSITDEDMKMLFQWDQNALDGYRGVIRLGRLLSGAADNITLDVEGVAGENQDVGGKQQKEEIGNDSIMDDGYNPIIDEIISRLKPFYIVERDKIFFNDSVIKRYAIFLKELYGIVYNITGRYNVQWRKLPIYPLKGDVKVTAEQLSNGVRNCDERKDAAHIKKYRAEIGKAYKDVMSQQYKRHQK